MKPGKGRKFQNYIEQVIKEHQSAFLNVQFFRILGLILRVLKLEVSVVIIIIITTIIITLIHPQISVIIIYCTMFTLLCKPVCDSK